jgi:hypothetical protein
VVGRAPAAEVEAGLLAGTWRCRDLNPYPGQPAQVIATTYAADGTFVSESELPGHGPVGPIAVTQRGRWTVHDRQLLTRDVTTAARALDGNSETDALAKASAEMLDLLGGRTQLASEILRLDARRLNLRPVGVTDPPVIGCTR